MEMDKMERGTQRVFPQRDETWKRRQEAVKPGEEEEVPREDGRTVAVRNTVPGQRHRARGGSEDFRTLLSQPSSAESMGDSRASPNLDSAPGTPDVMDVDDPSDIEDNEAFTSTLPSEKSHPKTFWDVLRGSMSNLPAMPTNTVRIFLSSTFSDFKAERNILPQFAYPRLEEICAARGIDFQVVDMRWGVPDEVVHDHQVSPLCIAEIKTCQQLSCGPSFVVLLGNRYGWQGFPPSIQCEEFSTLMAEVQNDADATLLSDWFRRDDNAVPPEYVLQSIHVHFKHYDDATDSAKREADQMAWQKVSGQLQTLLRSCARSAGEKGTFTEEQKRKYFMSVTEEEIIQGVFLCEDPSTQVMCYHRSLMGLDTAPCSKNLEKFIDLSGEEKTIDKESDSFRKSLLEDRLQPILLPSNMKKYQVHWREVPLENSSEEEHKEYLKQFCEDFIEDIKNLVFKKIDADQKSPDYVKWMSLYHEVLHHARFGRLKCEVFCGRQDEIQRIKNYLKEGKNGGHEPLVIHGTSGMGKTALMAYVASRVQDWFGSSCIAITRFLGTSPLSSNISEMLHSVIDQLSLLFRLKGLHDTAIEKFGFVRRKFHLLLEKVSRCIDGPLVLILDSVDQLSSANGAHRMVWLPKVLPKNVYLIASMLTEDRMYTLINTQKRVADKFHYLELSPLSEFTGDQIIDSHLARNRRRLTEEQRQLVVDAFKRMRHPLFLKLVIDEAKIWTSYLPVSEICMFGQECGADDAVKAAILSLFDNMETKHGVMFVQHALAYLTCGNGGLTEIEMEDILSCDDLVLNEVYQYHEPPLEGVIRIPSLLWARLQYALKEYICERRVDGKVVLAWYHRQFWEAAETRYLQPEQKKQYIHKALAELFLQETGIKRTITLHHFQGKVIKDADRRVKAQPLEVTNLRKLQAVPYHLYHSLDYDMLVSRCLINFEWLLLKLLAFHVNCVIRDFEVMDVHPDVSFFRKFLEICFDALSHDPYLLAYNIVERLECCTKGNRQLKTVVADAKKWLAKTDVTLLVPTYPIQLQPADSPQLFSIMLGYDGLLTSDESMIVCTWSESKIQTLDLKTRDIVASVRISRATPFKILPGNHSFVFVQDQHIKVHEIDTGDLISNFQIFEGQYEKVTVRCLGISENGNFAALTIKFGKPKKAFKKQWSGECIIYLIDLEKQQVVNSVQCHGRKLIDTLFFVQNDQFIIGTSKNKILMYSVPDMNIKKEFAVPDDLHASTFQKFSHRNLIIGLCSNGKEVKVVFFDYNQLDIKTSRNVHVDGDQKRALPFALHVKGGDLSSLLIGSWGSTSQEPLSSICLWGPNDGKPDAYNKIKVQPRGIKAPVSLTTTQDWQHALVGWQCGHISVINLTLKQELQAISAHGHAVYFMRLLSDGKTLVTASQDHSLKIWDLPLLIQRAKDENDIEGIEVPLESKCLHETEQCLDLIACEKFMVSAPSNNIWAPRFWSYDTGHILSELSKVYQELYDKSIENNKLDFQVHMHATVTELPKDVLVYERKTRNALTILVAQEYNEKAKILVHHRFNNTFFRLIVPVSCQDQRSLLYVVHDGNLAVYDITTLEIHNSIKIRAITQDIPRIESSGGRRRLLSYQVGVTLDEKYFLIVNPCGGPEGKYMDVIQVRKGKECYPSNEKEEARIPMVKYTPSKFLADGLYFLCRYEKQELCCFPAHICLENMKKRDFDYRSVVITGKFLSKDKSLGYSINNKVHTISVWQVEPLELLHCLRGHEHEVTSVDISPDNRFLVSGSYDNTVRVWELEKGSQKCMFHVFGAVDSVAFSPSMAHVAVQCYSAPQRKRAVSFALRNLY